MNTCALCGTELDDIYCFFCEMELDKRYILKDGERLHQSKMFKGVPDRSLIFRSTKELMSMETIDLLCLLRDARSFRAEVFKLRHLRHQAERQGGYNDTVQELEDYSYKQYEDATRKVWVIENIIKDRLGYYPERVTMNFLNMYIDRMEHSERKKKNMIIAQSIKS